MSGPQQAWGFTDDRGAELEAGRTPERVLAYVRAGAALLDLGVKPVAVYGSGHDGELLDPAKAGRLAEAGVPYLGPGRALDEERLRELRPELVVDVTYDGKSPYALDEAVAERLGAPLGALSVGNELTLPEIIRRFAELGGALGGTGTAAGGADLAEAEAALRTAAARAGTAPGTARAGTAAGTPARAGTSATGTAPAPDPRAPGTGTPATAPTRTATPSGAPPQPGVLALSGAGPEQVHLARPHAWPELARLAELGVRLLDPGPGPGASWLTADWERATELRPDLVLFDSRAHAVPPRAVPYGLPPAVRLVPWSPETPPSPAAYARFFRDLAAALT